MKDWINVATHYNYLTSHTVLPTPFSEFLRNKLVEGPAFDELM